MVWRSRATARPWLVRGRPHGQVVGLDDRQTHGDPFGIDGRALLRGLHARRIARAGRRRRSIDPDVAHRRRRAAASSARPSRMTRRSSGWRSRPTDGCWPRAPRIGRCRLWKLDTLTPAGVDSAAGRLGAGAGVSALMAGGWRWGVTMARSPCGIRPPESRRSVLREPPTAQACRGPPSWCGMPSLNPPSPRGAVPGRPHPGDLDRQGVGHATAIIIPEPGLSATIVPAAQPR